MTAWLPVTVVVPVGPGLPTIAQCLRALLDQDYPRNHLEIVLALDRPDGPTRACVAAAGERITVVEAARPGPSAARNAGIRHASTELIVFTDADCVPDRRWVYELVQYHQGDGAADIVGGRIEPFRPGTPVAAFVARLLDQAAAVTHLRTPHVITANMLSRRSVLFRLGLFDEELLRGQDVDLSLRARFDFGLRLGYAERACVRHQNVSTVSGLLRKGMQHGLAVFYVLSKHGPRVGWTPGQWLRRRDLNRRMVGNLLRARALPWAWMCSDPVAMQRYREAFYQGVFDAGKQWGLLWALWAHSGRARGDGPFEAGTSAGEQARSR